MSQNLMNTSVNQSQPKLWVQSSMNMEFMANVWLPCKDKLDLKNKTWSKVRSSNLFLLLFSPTSWPVYFEFIDN